MKRPGVTLKLFILTVIFFAIFYGMIILCHLLFFGDFYQKYKITNVERNLEKFASYYVNEEGDFNKLSREAVKFIARNKSQLAIVNMDGNLIMDDPWHIIIKKANGQKVIVSMSFIKNLYSNELIAAKIQEGDMLKLWGRIDYRSTEPSTVMYPEKIYKQGAGEIGEIIEAEGTVISGVVTDIVMPSLNTRGQGQGLLLEALYKWFPLSEEQKKELMASKTQEIEWIEPWSGTRNVIMIMPIKKETGEMELLFSLTNLQEISDANQALRLFYIYLGFGGFCLILGLSFFFSKFVTRPLITLNQMAKRMVHLDFSTNKPLQQNDELGSLSNSMLIMSQNLDKALRELREANQQLKNDMEQKQRMEKTQQSFFTNASHELKTPLSIVKSFAEGLQDGVNPDKREHYVSVIVEETEKMEMLIKDMLDLARLESGSIQLRRKSFLLSEMVERISEKLVYLLRNRQLSIIVVPVNELPVLADPDWIEQVILNFTVNAIRHAEEGSTITIVVQSDDRKSILFMDNKGEQIPEEQQKLIWERFYRGEESRSRQTGGTGLGLSIAKQILDLHGYDYAAENLPDGVRFVVIFHR
ncbi:signal transduction histidine kinase [Fontibacillus solani]|uniref:histidine kinase n=1 Tax=Fontibacillus solani TaxID=1572857 RepID=A0A7W3SYK3_9BACL|nr:HAMP domain-containing sensor histidine kinase [Fontibacillus solani]MBA9088313.1 signal transduction histidine kinase [Fontibacillus solani]